MNSKKTSLNLPGTLLIAIIGGTMPLIRNLFEVSWNFRKVEMHNYILMGLSVIGVFIAYLLANKISLHKGTDSYYLSILGIYFILTMLMMLLISVIMAMVA